MAFWPHLEQVQLESGAAAPVKSDISATVTPLGVEICLAAEPCPRPRIFPFGGDILKGLQMHHTIFGLVFCLIVVVRNHGLLACLVTAALTVLITVFVWFENV